MKNPDTHPNEFRRVQEGETVLQGAVYKRDGRNWTAAENLVGIKTTHVMPSEPLYNPVSAMKNPDTHPNEFRLAREGEIVARNWVYKSRCGWDTACDSVGRQSLHAKGDPSQLFYVPVDTPVPAPADRSPANYNPDTHPQDFHAVVEGEIVLSSAVFKNGKNWAHANESVGRARTHTTGFQCQLYNLNTAPISTDSKPQPERTKTMLIRTTIMHTPKVVPGSIPATEEVLIPSTEVAASDEKSALLIIGADNATTIKKAAKTSTLRIIQSTH